MTHVVLQLGNRPAVIDDTVAYMDVHAVGLALHLSSETWETICGCNSAIDLFWGVLQRGLPAGEHPLPVDDGPFADAVKLEGRWREVLTTRT